MENGGITLSDFNLDRALGGASIGWKDEEGNIIQALGFKRQNSELYAYTVDNMTYYCDKSGNEYNGSNRLYMLNLDITETKGTSASRGRPAPRRFWRPWPNITPRGVPSGSPCTCSPSSA